MIDVMVLLLIAANAAFVLLEFALMRVRPARIELLARKGSASALAVQDILSRFDEYLAAMQLCITVISLALGAVGEPMVMAQIEEHFSEWVAGVPGAWLHALAFAIAVTVLAFLQIIFAELIPRAVAIHYAEPIALFGARSLRTIAFFLRWPVRLTTGASKAVLRAFRLKAAAEAEHGVTVEEMRVLLGETQEKGAMPLERLILLENLFDIASAKASEAMRPREEIVYLSIARPWPENLQLIREKRFSRYPLCELGLETVVGYIHVKDFVLKECGVEPDLRKIRRDLFEITEGEPLEKLIKTMPDKGIHMALVRDAGGGVAGLLTLEDIVEELIGEVRDEFGRSRGWADGELFSAAVVDCALPAGDRRATIEALIGKLQAARPELDALAAFAAVWERETKFASVVGHGVIVPHARLPGLREPLIAVGRYAKPAAFPTPDNVPVRLVFLILTPAETPVVQLKILQRIASLVTNENLRRKLWKAKSDEHLLETLRTADTLLAS